MLEGKIPCAWRSILGTGEKMSLLHPILQCVRCTGGFSCTPHQELSTLSELHALTAKHMLAEVFKSSELQMQNNFA